MEYIWKTVRRAPFKSLLFLLLIGMISLFFCTAVNLTAVFHKNNSRIEDSYDIIATLNTDSLDYDELQSEFETLRKLPYLSIYETSHITVTSEQIKEPEYIVSSTLPYSDIDYSIIVNEQTNESEYIASTTFKSSDEEDNPSLNEQTNVTGYIVDTTLQSSETEDNPSLNWQTNVTGYIVDTTLQSSETEDNPSLNEQTNESEYIASATFKSSDEEDNQSLNEQTNVTGYIVSTTLQSSDEEDSFSLKEQMLVIFTYMGNSKILIEDRLFGKSDCVGVEMQVSNRSSYSGVFEAGKKYIAYGKIDFDHIDPTTYTNETVNSNSSFLIYDYDPAYYTISEDNDNSLDLLESYYYNPYSGVELYDNKSAYWEDIQKALELADNSYAAMSVKDVENMYDFHEDKAWLVDGEYFTEEDYKDGKRRCMIDHETAIENKLNVGDTINLHFFIGFSGYAPSDPDFWGNDFGEAEFEIAGIYSPSSLIYEDPNLVFDDQIIIPEQTMTAIVGDRVVEEFRLNGYQGVYKYLTIKVNKAYIKQFLKEASKLKEIKITLYDQGYSSVSGTIERLERLSKPFIILAGAAVILLTGVYVFLEYIRRGIDVRVMKILGFGGIKAHLYLLIAVLLVSVPAAVIGGVAGCYVSGKVINEIQSNETENQSSVAYAQLYGNGETIDFELELGTDYNTIFITVAAVNLPVIFYGIIGSFIMSRYTKKSQKSSRLLMAKGAIVV